MKIQRASVLALAVLCGCASQPSLPRIDDGASLSITVTSAAVTPGGSQIQNNAVGKDAGKGAKGGAIAGGAIGLTCGPFAFFCVPVTAGIGALSGAVGGAAVGAGTASLSEEEATKLRARFITLSETYDHRADLEAHITEQAAKRWTLTPDESDYTVNVLVTNLIFATDHGDQLRMILRVTAIVRDNKTKRLSPKEPKVYEYLSPYTNLGVWLDWNNDFAERSLRLGSQQIAMEILADLAKH